MLPFVRVGPLLVQLPGLALLAGVWIGTNFVEKEAIRLRLNATAILNLIVYGLIGGLVGARLLYALEHINAYSTAPLSLFALSTNALDASGGLLVGSAAALLYGRAKALPLRETLDALAPGLAVFMIASGVANFLSGHGYGSPLQAPWAIYLWGEYRHPTQIYETLLAVGVLFAWRFMPSASAGAGSRFWQVIGLSAAARLFTEAFHADSVITPGGLRLAQVVALLLLAAALYMGRRWAAAGAHAPETSAKRRRRAPALRGAGVGDARRKRLTPRATRRGDGRRRPHPALRATLSR